VEENSATEHGSTRHSNCISLCATLKAQMSSCGMLERVPVAPNGYRYSESAAMGSRNRVMLETAGSQPVLAPPWATPLDLGWVEVSSGGRAPSRFARMLGVPEGGKRMKRLIPCTCILKAWVAHMSLCRNGNPAHSRLFCRGFASESANGHERVSARTGECRTYNKELEPPTPSFRVFIAPR
jgi:hypothetical protein